MKIVMLFPGYMSQYVGMGKELYDESRLVQEYFEEASNCLNTNFVKQIFASSDSDLASASHAYTSEFVVSSAIFALLKQEGITPSLIAGYNLGAYAALFAAGGISFPDGLYLLNKYADLYQESLNSLSSVALYKIENVDTTVVEKYCASVSTDQSRVDVALYHTNDECIISGHSDLVEQATQHFIEENQAVITQLPLEIGLHSCLLDSMAAQLKIYLAKVDCKDLTTPVINTISSSLITSAPQVTELLVDLAHKPIRWLQSMHHFNSADLIIEVGPGNYLADLCKKEFPDKKIISVNTRADIEQLKKIIK